MVDYYETLGIPKNADKDTIKKGYRKLSKKFHPDLNPEDDFFEKMFLKVQKAYDVLSNEDSKTAYDALLFKSLNTHINTKPKFSNKPLIKNFSSNKSGIRTSEPFTLSWNVQYADIVEIKPFGEFEAVGTKSFVFSKMHDEYIHLVIIAHNKNTSESSRSHIKIHNLSHNRFPNDLKSPIYWDSVFISKVIIIGIVIIFILIIIIFGIEVNDPISELKQN